MAGDGKKLNHVVMADSNKELFDRHFTWPCDFGESKFPAGPELENYDITILSLIMRLIFLPLLIDVKNRAL